MMEQWNRFPFVLRRKFLFTLLAGIASVGISAIIYVTTRDRILLTLGMIIFGACLISGKRIWDTAVHKNYDVIEGVCTGISTPILRRYRKVHLVDGQDMEITLLLSKSVQLRIGTPYRFYFQKGSRPTVGNEYLDAALSTNNFLGYEECHDNDKDFSQSPEA